MSDYLPPAVLKLVSEFDPKGVEEAKLALSDLRRDTDRRFAEGVGVLGAEGGAAGRAYGEGVSGGAQPGLEKLTGSTRKARDSVNSLSDSFVLAKHQGDWFARMDEGTARATDYLDDRVKVLQGDVRKLGEEFNKTGNVHALDKMFDAQKMMRDLETIRTRLGKALGEDVGKSAGKDAGTSWTTAFKDAAKRGDTAALDALAVGLEPAFQKAGKDGSTALFGELSKALGPKGLASVAGRQMVDTFTKFGTTGGIQAGSTFSKGFMGALGDIASSAAPAMVPLGIGLASFLLAGFGGMIESAAGLGAVFAAALVQIKTNPQVQTAAKGFGSWISTQFKDVTASFAQPLMDAFKILKTDLSGPFGELRKDFAILAPYVRDFAMYLGAAAEKLMPGFNKLIQASGPMLKEFGRVLVYVADGLSTMFDQISKGGRGEAEALDALGRVLGDLLASIGYFIHGASMIYDWMVKAAVAVTAFGETVYHYASYIAPPLELVSKLFGAVHDRALGIAGAYDDAGSSVASFGKKIDTTTAELDRQKAAVDALQKSYDDWFGKSMSVDKAQLTLLDSMAQLKKATQGQKDAFNLSTDAGRQNYGMLLTNIQNAKDLRDAQIASGIGTAQADAAFQKEYDTLIAQAKQAGLTESQIAVLTSQFGQLKASLDSIDGTTVHWSISGPGGAPASWSMLPFMEMGGVIPAASGLISGVLPARNPGTLVLAGEPGTKGEVFAPLAGISQRRAMGLAQIIGDAYDFDVMPRGPSSAALSSLAQATPPTAGPSGGYGMAGGYVPIVVNLGGTHMATVHAALIPQAQRYKSRTGTTGLA